MQTLFKVSKFVYLLYYLSKFIFMNPCQNLTQSWKNIQYNFRWHFFHLSGLKDNITFTDDITEIMMSLFIFLHNKCRHFWKAWGKQAINFRHLHYGHLTGQGNLLEAALASVWLVMTIPTTSSYHWHLERTVHCKITKHDIHYKNIKITITTKYFLIVSCIVPEALRAWILISSCRNENLRPLVNSDRGIVNIKMLSQNLILTTRIVHNGGLGVFKPKKT